MADISLSVYQNKIEGLLENNKFNEAITHCRHILVAHPKNLKAYSQLGRALFSASRWEETGEIFRRLLGSLPNDFTAHMRLSKVYRHLDKDNEAIWHAERAFDQQPNNAEVINQIRDLYLHYRVREVGRLQLTAGAVAQQHIRNSLYPQAIAVLDKALKRYPDRIDLKILRARALWLNGKQMDAAESAIEVLEILPYSMTANRILTDLWLAQQRPSDAQRYLSRIEDLDPYLAYRLATGDTAPESLIEIEELDYDAISRHELTTTNPDWLSNISEVSETDDDLDFGELDDDDFADLIDSQDDEVAQPIKVTDDLEDLLSDEWQERVDSLDEGESILTEDADIDFDDLFGELEDEDDLLGEDDVDLDDLFSELDSADDSEIDDEPIEDEIDLEALFGDDDDDDDDLHLPDGVSTDDLPDGLLERIEKMKGMSQSDTMPAANRPPIEGENLTGLLNQLDVDDDADDLDWLVEAQRSNLDTGELTLPDELQDEEDAGESDWLGELEDIESSPDASHASTGLTGMFDEDADDEIDLFGDEDELEALLSGELEDEEPINPDDPNAWMKQSGIEFDENAEDHNPFDMEDEDDVIIESAEVNPMAWLGGDDGDDDSDDISEATDGDLDAMAWMSEEGIEIGSDTDDLFADEDIEAEAQSAPQFFDDDDDDLFGDIGETDEGNTDDDLFGDIGETDEGNTDDLFAADKTDESNIDDLFGDDDMLEEMLSFEDDDEDVTFGFDTEDEDASDDIGLSFDVEESEDDSVSDAPSTSDDRQDDMNDDFSNDWEDNMPDDENDSMDWLNDDGDDEMPDLFGDDSDSAPLEQASVDDDDDVDLEDMFAQMMDEELEADESGLEWLQADELVESADVDLSIGADELEEDELDPMAWMNEEDIETTDDVEDPMAWLNGEDVELTVESADGTGMTDMLDALEQEDDDFSFKVDSSDVEDNFLDSEDENNDDGAGHWLDNALSEASNDELSEEPDADWLAEIEDDGEFEASDANSEIEWLADDASENFSFEADEDSQPTDDLFDFEEDDSQDEFSFDTSSAPIDNEPDWLSEMSGFTEDEDDTEEEVDDISDLFGEMSDDAEEEVDDISDLFGEMSDDAEEEVDDIADLFGEMSDDAEEEVDDIADLFGEMSDDAEEEVVMEQPDWLSDVSRDDSDIDGEDDLEPAVANTEDWLSELGEFEGEEDSFVVDDEDSLDLVEEEAEPNEIDWLSDMGGFEEESEPSPKPSSVTDELDWMADDEELSEETAVGATASANFLEDIDPSQAESALDWMTEDETDDEFGFEEVEEQATGITDWLTGDDSDEPEAEAVGEASDADDDWLSDIGGYESDESAMMIAEADDDGDDKDDWLSDIGGYEGGEDELVADEQPDWLASAAPDATYDYENDDTLVGMSLEDELLELEDLAGSEDEPAAEEDEPDWLSGMGVGDGVQDAFGEDDADEIDWGADQDELEEAEVADEPDWLSGMGVGDGVQDAFGEDDADDNFSFEDDFEEQVAEDSGALVGLSDINDNETEDEFDVTYEEEALPEFEDEEFYSAETQASSGLDEFEEELEHTPADDAPDWLNAMVPGLDIDYEPEDEHDEVVEDAPPPQSDKGFDWLSDIVEEETGAMAPIVPNIPKPQPLSAPRFNFSKRPAWMERLLGGASAVASAVGLTQDEAEEDTRDDDDFDFSFDESLDDDNGDTVVNEAIDDDDDFDFSFDESLDDDDTIADDSDDFDDDFPDWLDIDDDD